MDKTAFTPPDQLIDPLTPRELEVLELLSGDQSNQEIADQLFLALSSLKWYVGQIYQKLEVSNRRQAVHRAQELRLLGGPSTSPIGKALPAGTITFLFTDIQDSTPLWESRPQRMSEALHIHNAILQQVIEAHAGSVFKIIWDSVQVAFPTAPQALKAAIEGQRALQSAPWNELGEYSLKGLSIPERLFQVCAPGLRQEFPPLLTAPTHLNNFPIKLTSFIGREKEIASICHLLTVNRQMALNRLTADHRLADEDRLLAIPRLVTLTGSGGTGKTRLALQVANELLNFFPHGAWLVELAPVTDPNLVPQAVASALHIQETPGQNLMVTLVNYLHAKHLMLILDNCEHVQGTCTDLADTLLTSCPDLSILATSREIMGVEGEVPFRVPPMSMPDMRRQLTTEALVEYDAVRLFTARARLASPGFSLTNDNASTIVQIILRLDGIPLAIELAAARLRLLSVEQIAERLNDAFHLLTGGSRTVLPRHQTLRASIDWSYNLLSDLERTLLRRLSVFATGWTLEAAEAVCSLSPASPTPAASAAEQDYAHKLKACHPLCPDDILDLLSHLVNKSLINTVIAEDGSVAFHMLETIRQYAHEKLVDAGEVAAVRTAHLEYYLRLVETLEPKIRSREQIRTLDHLELELDNLRLAEVGWAAFEDADFKSACAALEASLMYRRQVNNLTFVGVNTLWLGIVYQANGDLERAGQCFNQALSCYSEFGIVSQMANVLFYKCCLSMAEGRYELTSELNEEAWRIAQKTGSQSTAANILYFRARLARLAGDGALAQKHAQEGLDISLRQGTPAMLNLLELGYLALQSGNLAQTLSLWQEAMLTKTGWEDPTPMMKPLDAMALLAAREGKLERATRLFSARWHRGIINFLSPSERAQNEAALAAVRDALGEARYEQLSLEGQSMNLEQVVAYALEEGV